MPTFVTYPLQPLAGDTQSKALGISEKGHLAGLSISGSGSTRAVAFQPFEDYGRPAGTIELPGVEGIAEDLNRFGQVVGKARSAGVDRAAQWDLLTLNVTNLGGLDPNLPSWAFGINDDPMGAPTVVGRSAIPLLGCPDDTTFVGFRKQPGSAMQQLVLLPGDTSGSR